LPVNGNEQLQVICGVIVPPLTHGRGEVEVGGVVVVAAVVVVVAGTSPFCMGNKTVN
jgi:hypothetical protein